MPRSSTTSILRAFLGANPAKPEEQAVAVLASALRTNPSLVESLVLLAGGEPIEEDATTAVGTEEPTFVGRDHIDLEIIISRPGLRNVQRIWIEAKLDAPLARGPRHQ